VSQYTDDELLLKRRMRFAGLLYLLVVLIAPIGLIYVPNKLFVPGDASATAAAIRASESLLRLGIASELVHQAIEVFLVLVLYRVFKPVQDHWSKQMLVLGLIPIPIVFLNTLNELATIMLLEQGRALSAFTPPQLDALAYVFIRLHGQGLAIASVFWGLWLFPLGALIVRSGFVPRFVGGLAALAGAGYLLDALARLVVPRFAATVSQIALPLQVCELGLVLWLVLVGARPKAANAMRENLSSPR